MDYEQLYEHYLVYEKALKDTVKNVSKLQKSIAKLMDGGDLFRARTDAIALEESSGEIARLFSSLNARLADFDARAYVEGGDFARQLVDECRRLGVDVIGEFPVYEMFPYKVRIDVENQEVWIDRKKVPGLRPTELARQIRTGQEKLYKVNFKADRFVEELYTAYELFLLKNGKADGSDVFLDKLYPLLVPMARARKEYDKQAYAFDIARLFEEKELVLKNGKRFQFGPSRNINKALRILDSTGREHFLATIRFF